MVRKNDTLVFEIQPDFDFTSTFNSTDFDPFMYKLQIDSQARIEMVFDWTIPTMRNSKNVSTLCFWILIGIVVL